MESGPFVFRFTRFDSKNLTTATVHNDGAYLVCEVLRMGADIATAFDKTLGVEGMPKWLPKQFN
eukprot:COSAG02_NODE_1280_length_13477_cov_9.042906_2_plen_64_part_00